MTYDREDYEGPYYRVEADGNLWAVRRANDGHLEGRYVEGGWALFENRLQRIRKDGRCARCERGDERVLRSDTYAHPYSQDGFVSYHPCYERPVEVTA